MCTILGVRGQMYLLIHFLTITMLATVVCREDLGSTPVQVSHKRQRISPLTTCTTLSLSFSAPFVHRCPPVKSTGSEVLSCRHPKAGHIGQPGRPGEQYVKRRPKSDRTSAYSEAKEGPSSMFFLPRWTPAFRSLMRVGPQ